MRDPRKQHGRCVYHDTSSKGNGSRHDCWRAEQRHFDGKRIRRRFKERVDALAWCYGSERDWNDAIREKANDRLVK